MKREHSITFNFIMNFILTASSFVFPLITFPYVSRVLLPVGNGKIASATAVITYFSMISMLGIPTYGIRACAQVRDNKEKLSQTVQEILIINVFMTILVYIAFAVSLHFVPKFAKERTLFIVMSATIFLNVIGVSWLYSALEEYAYITMISLLFKVIGVILMFLFVHEEQDYVIYGGITVISNVGSYLFNFLRLRKYIICRPLGNYNFRRHLKPIGIFCAMTVATSIYTNLDVVMLNFISGDEQVGYYNAAVKIKTIITSLVTSIGAVLLPRLSYYIEKGMKAEFKKMASKALQFVTMMSLPLSIYFMMFARESVGLLSGTAYQPAVPSMCMIMPTVIFIGMSNIFGMQILVPTDREKEVLFSVIIGGIIDLILNMLLIPVLGALGAAIGTLMAEFAVVLVQVIILRNFLSEIKSEYKIFYYIAAAIPAAAISWTAKKMLWSSIGEEFLLEKNCFLILAVTSIIFFGIYGSMLLITKEPIAMEYIVPYLKKIKRGKEG